MRRALLILLAVGCKSREPAPAPTPQPPPTPELAVTAAVVDVTVVPMDSDKQLPNQTVLVDGTKIVAIGPAASTKVPDKAKKIDGRGKWLMPGLVDMHVHFNDERYGLLFVANGVTSVRNMWGNEDVLEWRSQARANDSSYLGPSIYTAGPIVDGTPPIWPGSRGLSTAADAEAEVAAQVKAGYDLIKVYDRIPLDAYNAVAAAAKQAKVRIVGHLPKAVSLAHAIASGQQSIEHLTGYRLAAQDATSRAATLEGKELEAELVAHLDPAKLPVLAKQTADAKLANVPTLIVMDRFASLDRVDELRARPDVKYIPPSLLAAWDPKQDFRAKKMTPDSFKAMRAANEFRAKLVRTLFDAGAPILAGSDTPNPFVVPGFSLHEELALLVGAGLTPYQALRAATVTAADWLGWKDVGRIAVGARADLMLLDADPLADINATKRRSGVMVRGTWFPQSELDDRLAKLAASYTAKADRLAKAPALEIPAGTLLFTGSYMIEFAGAPVGEERLAVVRTKDGGRIIVAQSAGDPPSPELASVRIELDAKGKLRSFTIDEDGKRATAKLTGAKLELTAEGVKSETTLTDELLFDANMVATMMPFADRAKPGATTKVIGKSLAGSGKLADVAYTFDRTGSAIAFTASGPFGDAPGTYEVDDKGFVKSITLKAGPGELVVTRR